MKLYICIYNTEKRETQGVEEYPIDSDQEKEWARKNVERMELQCVLYRPEEWKTYVSTDAPFEWPEEE